MRVNLEFRDELFMPKISYRILLGSEFRSVTTCLPDSENERRQSTIRMRVRMRVASHDALEDLRIAEYAFRSLADGCALNGPHWQGGSLLHWANRAGTV